VWYAFDITDINEKGENKYSMPGLGVVSCHFERHIHHYRALPLLSLTLTLLSGCIFDETESI
jgi:hypothetical protein